MKAISKGIFLKKLGMTQVYSPTGEVLPVTVLQPVENVVIQLKSDDRDGYTGIKVAYELCQETKLNKAKQGQLKSGDKFYKRCAELRLKDTSTLALGDQISLAQFANDERVNVTGIMKGRGFAGTVKRYNFTIGPISHGSKHHRRKGTSGAGTGQAKVWRGQKTAGHYGNETITVKNMKIVKVDSEKNVLILRGAVPGANGTIVKIYN